MSVVEGGAVAQREKFYHDIVSTLLTTSVSGDADPNENQEDTPTEAARSPNVVPADQPMVVIPDVNTLCHAALLRPASAYFGEEDKSV